MIVYCQGNIYLKKDTTKIYNFNWIALTVHTQNKMKHAKDQQQ
jgi:hypothetical protein